MSGHSKWATTRRQKATIDAKRANIFTKLSNAISIAAKEGSDLETNFKLRIAVDKAKQANMPKDNIERAIARGSGKNGETQLEQLTYEGFGPEKIGVIVEAVTDNRNRTVASLKQIFSKYGGQLAASGAVLWTFDRLGVVVCKMLNKITEEQELNLIDAGADDWEQQNEQIIIYTAPQNLQKINEQIKKLDWEIISSELEYLAKETVKVTHLDKWEQFKESLEEDDDVNNYFSNASD
jgi:YebC/PmpR family DNA-binding regulatory protein